jgi:hypothetical protein
MADNIEELKKLTKAANEAAGAINEASTAFEGQAKVIEQLTVAFKAYSTGNFVKDIQTVSQELQVAQQAVKAFSDQGKQLEDQLTSIGKQMTSNDQNYQSLVEKLTKISETFEKMKKTGEKNPLHDEKEGKKVNDNIKTMNQQIKDQVKTIGLLGGAFIGLKDGWKSTLAMGGGVIGLFTNLAGWAMKLSMAIISIPVNFLGTLVRWAAQMQGSTEYMQKIEEVREKFGNFQEGQSKAIMEMQKSFARVTETGLNAWRIYGDLAERLGMITKMIEGLGAAWNVFADEFAQDGYLQAKRINEFQLGLGLSEEQLKTTLTLTKAMGQSAGKTLTDLTKHVKGYAAAYHISHKVISRDVAEAIKDAGRFGGATVDSITRASVYAQKLGHNLKDIAGVMTAFETFDTAAEGAAKLSQTFGATVDAFKLVKAQNPDEMIQHLRDAMFAAGKSAEKMSRQELKLLSQQSGLTEEVARSVFSMNNAGVSVDELRKKQEAQEDSAVTQAKALKSLSEDIKRMVKQQQQQAETYVKQFLAGMMMGIRMSEDFRKLMMNIKKGLHLVWLEGRQFGIQLMTQVPLVKQMMKALQDFFAPGKYQKLAQQVRHILMSLITGNEGVPNIMHKMSAAFMQFFDSNNPAIRQMLASAKGIMVRVSKIIGESILWVTDQIGDGIKALVDIISGKKRTGAISFGSAATQFVWDIIKPIFDALYVAVPKLGMALFELLQQGISALYTRATTDPQISSVLKKVALAIAGIFVVNIASRAIMGAITAGITNAVIGGIGGLASGGGMAKIAAAGKEVAAQSAKTSAAMGKEGATASGATTRVANGWAQAALALKRVSITDIGKMFLILTAIAAGLAVGGIAFAGAVKLMAEELKDTKSEDVAKAVLSMTGLVLNIAILAGTVKLLGNIDFKSLGMGALVILAMGGVLGGLMWLMGALTKSMKEAHITGSELAATAGVLKTLALTMLIMVPVITAAAIFGSAIIATSGALALAAAAGLTAITAAMGGLVGVTIGIMEQLRKMPKDDSLPEKTKSFTNIFDAITKMISVLGKTLADTAPSIADFLTGTSVVKRMQQSVALIDEIRGTVTQMIDKIMVIVNLYKDNPTLVKGAAAVGGLISSVTGLMLALKVPKELASGSFDLGWSGISLKKPSEDAAMVMFQMQQSASSLIGGVIGLMKSVGGLNLNDQALKSIPVISELLKVMGTILGELTPSADMLAQFQKIKTTSGSAKGGLSLTEISQTVTTSLKEQELDSDALMKMMQFARENLTKIFELLSSDTFKKVVDMTKDWSPKQLDGIKAIASIMSAIGSIMSAMNQSFAKVPKVEVQAAQGANVTNILKIPFVDINETLSKLTGDKGGIKQLFNTIIGLATDLGKTAGGGAVVTSSLKSVMGVFEGIKGIIAFLSNTAGMATKAYRGGVGVDATTTALALTMPLEAMIMLLRGLNQPAKDSKSGGSLMNEIVNQLAAVSAAGTMSAAEVKNVGSLVQTFKELQKIQAALGEVGASFSGSNVGALYSTFPLLTGFVAGLAANISPFSTQLSALTQELTKMGVAFKPEIVNKSVLPMLEAFSKVVSAVREVHNSLNDINLGKKPIAATLNSIAGQLGIGGKVQFTPIENKAVQIHLTVEVSMRAADVEKAMVCRSTSIIRDQINWIRKSGSSAGKNEEAFKMGNHDIPGDLKSEYMPVDAPAAT